MIILLFPISENMTHDEIMEALARLMFPCSDECQIIQLKETLKENDNKECIKNKE